MEIGRKCVIVYVIGVLYFVFICLTLLHSILPCCYYYYYTTVIIYYYYYIFSSLLLFFFNNYLIIIKCMMCSIMYVYIYNTTILYIFFFFSSSCYLFLLLFSRVEDGDGASPTSGAESASDMEGYSHRGDGRENTENNIDYPHRLLLLFLCP